MARCMQCGGMKKTPTALPRKKAGGVNKLNDAKGYSNPTKGGSNVGMNIYGIPNAGTTGPNRTAGYQYKAGGTTNRAVQESCKKGMVRDANGKCVMERMERKMAKGGSTKSFPDLNKDGKITKADILKGRGVINKKGGMVKKKK